MKITNMISDHMMHVHKGGNWTVTNLEETLNDVTFVEAQETIHDLNTIAVLTFHINYFILVANHFLETGELNGNDKESFSAPMFETQKEWQDYVFGVITGGEKLAQQIKQLDDSLLLADFGNSKYGNHFRNLIGIIEHTHYHLGQISLIKKLLRAS